MNSQTTSLGQQSKPLGPLLLLQTLEAELKLRASHQRLKAYLPYQKQADFHAAGLKFRERLLMAGNQLGKTMSAAAETAIHATGRYPDWWKGRFFDSPINAWVSGVTGESTRDNPQRWLYGALGAPGTGMIPKDAIKDTSPRRGLADAMDTMIVKHGGGGDIQSGESQIGFKSYDQGREKWQGPTKQLIWFDEEPPPDIYTEGLTRTNVGLCPVMLTFTPLLGMSDVVTRFLIDKVEGTHVTQMTIDDVEHYTPEQRQAIIASYPAHEREARAKGIPTMGSGRVFPIEEEFIKCEPFDIPKHWVQLAGLDFGWDHPSAGARLAWDRDTDTIYVTATHRARQQTPAIFALAVKPWGHWLPWAWPHDGLQHEKGSGEQLAKQYKEQGLSMLRDKATHAPKEGEAEGSGGNSVEAGVTEMLDRMQTGRWKVFSHLNDWFEEFRLYHRKDGLIVKLKDDVISASRYAMMMRRYAKAPPAPPKRLGMHESAGWMA